MTFERARHRVGTAIDTALRLLPLVMVVMMEMSFTADPGRSNAEAATVPQAPSGSVAVVPFELYHNRVYLMVKVNGAGPLRLILDTGSVVSGLNQARARDLGLQLKGKGEMRGNGEKTTPIELAKNVSFGLGGVELVEKAVAVFSFQDFESYEGRAVDGILGINLFYRYIAEIDYANKTLKLYEPKGYAYSGDGEIVPLPLFHCKIEIAGQGPIDAEMGIDQGTYTAVRLFRTFTEKHGLIAADNKNVLPSFGYGLGGEYKEVAGRVQTLQIGRLKIYEPVTSFSQASSGATVGGGSAGTIGGEILRRFKVILDYSRKQMILEPSANFGEPYSADMSGLMLISEGKDLGTIRARHVLEKTPAAQAGVREGDVIETIDDKAAAEIGFEQIQELFRHEGTYLLGIKRGEQRMQITIKARRLI
jgi:hypothetical protein